MATDKVNEQELQFRKRARRRLIGAIVLVLLMITLLPMMLDEPEPEAQQPEIAISIPSQNDTEFASRVVPEAPPSMPPVLEATQGQSGGAGESTAETAGVRKSTSSAGSSATAAVSDTNVQQPIAEKKSIGETKPSVSQQDAQLASADHAPAGEGTYLVQIGVFSDAAKVKQLQAGLAKRGVQTYTEKLATPNGMKIRLRVGPFPSRAQAEKSRDAIKAAGLDGMVIADK